MAAMLVATMSAIKLQGSDRSAELDVHLVLESGGRAVFPLASLSSLLPSTGRTARSRRLLHWAQSASVEPINVLLPLPTAGASRMQPAVTAAQLIKMLVHGRKGNLLCQDDIDAFLTSLADHLDVVAPYSAVAAAAAGGSVVRHGHGCAEYAHPILEGWRNSARQLRNNEYLRFKTHILDTLELSVPQFAPDIWAAGASILDVGAGSGIMEVRQPLFSSS